MDLVIVWTTLKLACVVTIVLLFIGIPTTWWLSQTKWRFKGWVESFLLLPLVLPPTVLGFYLLLLFSPRGTMGQSLEHLGVGSLAFSFSGIVIACTLHSMPFVLQPLKNAFVAIGHGPLEVAATLRASPWDRFWTIAIPLAWPGIFSAGVLGFCHTLGEFGVVLMLGGNIPGQTRVMSVEIYNQVESLNYANAHLYAASLVCVSFLALLMVYRLNHRRSSQRG